jgi:hypothetical protein
MPELESIVVGSHRRTGGGSFRLLRLLLVGRIQRTEDSAFYFEDVVDFERTVVQFVLLIPANSFTLLFSSSSKLQFRSLPHLLLLSSGGQASGGVDSIRSGSAAVVTG